MNDRQHQTDIDQVKAKLQEVEATKEGRRDPRQPPVVQPGLRRRTDERVPEEERIIKEGKTKPKTKKFGRKLKEAMFSEDIGNGSVTEYLFFKMLIPSVKRVLSDMANTAINMALGLDPKTRTIGTGTTHTANARLYSERSRDSGYSRRGILDGYYWDEATTKRYFDTILEVADTYGDISIMSVKSIVGLGDTTRTTDRKWGWTKAMLSRADCVPIDPSETDWEIILPEPRPIN